MPIIAQHWKFCSFLNRGECVIHQWMTEIGIKAKGIQRIEARFNYLSVTQIWEPHYAKKLKGYDDLFEIRIRHEKVQFRPLGWFGPFPNQFTLLIGAVEKDWDFEPRNAPAIAMNRRQAINQDGSLIYEYQTYISPSKRSDEK